MNTDSLNTLLKKGESEIMEFKEGFDKEVIETAVAFANVAKKCQVYTIDSLSLI
jgi:predicted HTH transcriptional regulator